ncbi:ATP-binding cassette domain-containing protein [Acidipila sp. EB88]|uniref:ATP-binding cassette domain-containing protein n=1 Tax=Acidipila sp. EB88 TaxID=2305226 RepID=UPI0018F4015D|nr:ABC transporter ATP-binding protein [Acidipila sp. EB88]
MATETFLHKISPVTAAMQDISHIYGGVPVLRHVQAALLPGACYLMLGANGAGKSTLLRILAGLLQPSFGSVSTWGVAPADARERIGYMSHAPMLYDEFTGAENLRYFAALYAGRPCLSVAEAFAAVGLDSSLPQPVQAYSQGMRQRLSLARVLLPRPELLLLDEPFSNMDANSAAAMLSLLARERNQGRTIVLTTHQRALAEPIADQLLLLADGELQTALPGIA